MEVSPAPLIHTGTAPGNFFRKPYTATVAFAIGLLLFLLPFAEMKCTSVTLADNTGIGIATGKKWRVVSMDEISPLIPRKEAEKLSTSNPIKTGLNVFLLVGFAAGAIGMAFSFSSVPMRNVIGISTGILAALMLIAVMIQFRLMLRSAPGLKEDSKLNMGMILKIHFTIWYYLSLFSFLTAAFFSYKHHQAELADALASHVDFEFQRDTAE